MDAMENVLTNLNGTKCRTGDSDANDSFVLAQEKMSNGEEIHYKGIKFPPVFLRENFSQSRMQRNLRRAYLQPADCTSPFGGEPSVVICEHRATGFANEF